jgi:hypothetical protein
MFGGSRLHQRRCMTVAYSGRCHAALLNAPMMPT